MINGVLTECLIHSGAQSSFVSHDFAKARGFKYLEASANKNYIAANGSRLKIIGRTELKVKIGNGKEITASFVIADDIAYNIIVGTNILSNNKVVIDYEKRKLRYQDQALELKSAVNSILISAQREIVLEPYSS